MSALNGAREFRKRVEWRSGVPCVHDEAVGADEVQPDTTSLRRQEQRSLGGVVRLVHDALRHERSALVLNVFLCVESQSTRLSLMREPCFYARQTGIRVLGPQGFTWVLKTINPRSPLRVRFFADGSASYRLGSRLIAVELPHHLLATLHRRAAVEAHLGDGDPPLERDD